MTPEIKMTPHHRAILSLAKGVAILVGFLVLPGAARAMPACQSAALAPVFGNSAQIHEVSDWGAINLQAPKDGAAHSSMNGAAFCAVTGDLALSTEEGDRENFVALFPDSWNGKILQVGCGGNCGRIFLGAAPLGWVKQGYAVWATDDGHVAGKSPAPRLWDVVESSWAKKPGGLPDKMKQSAFLYRGVHGLAVSAKGWTANYYNTPAKTAYFSGCSDGGREALVEAERFPDDFDGILAGDPYFDIEGEVLSALAGVEAQMQGTDAALSTEQWHAADAVILAKCDAADGVKDGLIQNPAMCDFKAERDLPHCVAGQSGACFTEPQMRALNVMLSAMTLPSGKVIYPGFPSSDLAKGTSFTDNLRYWVGFDLVPGGWKNPTSQPEAWYFGNQTLTNFTDMTDAGLKYAMVKGSFSAIVPQASYDTLRSAVQDGDATDPAALAGFIHAGHKLVLFHGLADGDITPYRTLNFYRALAAQQGGYTSLANHVVLFAVPGMAHCGSGPGPDAFGQSGGDMKDHAPESDILAALDGWVTQGHQPVKLIASHSEDQTVSRTMPLCPYPQMAKYSGQGDVMKAASWRCDSQDQRMLNSGPAGMRAGYLSAVK